MIFGDIRTVGELIDALEHFDRETVVEIHSGCRTYEIGRVGLQRNDSYYATTVVAITGEEKE
jgi:hypothetical protein